MIENFSGIPLKELCADSLTTLDLSGKALGVPEAMVLAGVLPVLASLTSVWTPAHEPCPSCAMIVLQLSLTPLPSHVHLTA